MIRSVMVVAAWVAAAPVQASLLVNGSFETPVVGGGYAYFGGSVGGWTYSGGSGNIRGNPDGAWNTIAQAGLDGSQFAFLQGIAAIEQGFTITAAGRYRLTWADAGPNRPAYDGQQTYVVQLSGKTLATHSTVGSTSFTTQNLSLGTLPAGQTYTLRFASQVNTVDVTSFIDNVVLSVAPVPEPGSWMLLIAGLGVIGASGRRRKLRVAA